MKNIGSIIWRAVTSSKGKAILSLGASWLVDRVSKGSPRAQEVVALTAREYGRLEALSQKTGIAMDDVAVEVFAPAMQKARERMLVQKTVELLRANPADVTRIRQGLPLPPSKE